MDRTYVLALMERIEQVEKDIETAKASDNIHLINFLMGMKAGFEQARSMYTVATQFDED